MGRRFCRQPKAAPLNTFFKRKPHRTHFRLGNTTHLFLFVDFPGCCFLRSCKHCHRTHSGGSHNDIMKLRFHRPPAAAALPRNGGAAAERWARRFIMSLWLQLECIWRPCRQLRQQKPSPGILKTKDVLFLSQARVRAVSVVFKSCFERRRFRQPTKTPPSHNARFPQLQRHLFLL